MKNTYYALLGAFFISFSSPAQELPEYNNSATAWNNKTNQSVSLIPEDGLQKTKTAGAIIGKVKVVMQFQGAKSKARIIAEDTLKIFAKIDKDTNPEGLFKIYKATIVNGNREVLVMKTSVGRGAERSDGDYTYNIKKVSPGIVRVDILNVKPGEELFFYIGTHESSLAIKTKIPFVLALISVSIFSCSHHEKRETKYPDGKPLESFEVLETKDGSFVKDGEYKTWYPGEKPESEGQYKDGKKTGNWKTWYSNGQMKSDHNYILDTLEGDYLAWYENGQKKIETQTSSGNYVGHFVSWFENGQMALDLTYSEPGKQTGPYTEWYENGQTKWKSNFSDKGNKIGTHTLWHTNGQKAGEWNYDDKGKLNGSLKYWDDKGHLFVYREFKDDIDVNLPATYKRTYGDKLELSKDGTFKLAYLQQLFFSRSWKTAQGKFEITTPAPEARLKLGDFANAALVKFNTDSIVYKNSFSTTDIVFIRQK